MGIANFETAEYNIDEKTEFSRLPLSNNYMFGRVMRNPKVCKLFLEALLGVKIAEIKYLDTEKDLSSTLLPQYHGIRLDVFVEEWASPVLCFASDEAHTRYNIEMQRANNNGLERRCRYYQSGIDRDFLASGEKYDQLPESFIIFVCEHDYFGAGLACYQRESRIVGMPKLEYNDGSHVIILNAAYKTLNVSPDIDEFLSFVRTVDGAAELNTQLGTEVSNALTNVRNDDKEERGYMTLLEYGRQQLDQGKAEGRAEGRADLIKTLLKTMKAEEVSKVTEIPMSKIERIAETKTEKNPD